MRFFFALLAALAGCVLVLPVLLLVLPFFLVNFLTRLLARVMEPSHLTAFQLIEYDPEFGWRPRPNLNTYHLSVDLFHIRTGADGWRGNATLTESDLVVFGDSFAAGYGVGERHFFANLRAKPRIKPVGIGGYSMVQEYLWMKRLAPQLRGKLVVWFIYFGNDLADNLCPDLRGYRKPFLRRSPLGEKWEIFSNHVSPDRWPIVTKLRLEEGQQLPMLAEFCCPGYQSERAYSACEFLISEGRQLCAGAGADLVVMTIPDPFQLSSAGHAKLLAVGGNREQFDADYPDRQVQSICRRQEVEFLPAKSFLDLTCYKSNDCHWNEHGHRRMADQLAALYSTPRARVKGHRPGREVLVP